MCAPAGVGGSGAIIRLTSDVDRASFRDQAMGCLMKPLKAEEVYRELDRVLDWIAGRQEDKVSVSVRGGVRVLPLSELLYVDLQNRVLHYHNLDGSIAASLTLRTSFQKAVEPLLSDGRFFRCGTSFAVNLHHLRSVEQDSLLLDNGGRVPLRPPACPARPSAGGPPTGGATLWPAPLPGEENYIKCPPRFLARAGRFAL